jgi:hypothetical protein
LARRSQLALEQAKDVGAIPMRRVRGHKAKYVVEVVTAFGCAASWAV